MIKAMSAMLISMLVMDGLWIQLWMKQLYQGQVAHLLRGSGGAIAVDPLATILVYFVMLVGLFYLAVKPSHSVQEALVHGAVAGCFAYGTFALTNHAIFKDWNWSLTLFDLGWGTLMMAVVAAIGFQVSRL